MGCPLEKYHIFLVDQRKILWGVASSSIGIDYVVGLLCIKMFGRRDDPLKSINWLLFASHRQLASQFDHIRTRCPV